MTVLTIEDKPPWTPVINLIAAPLGSSVQFVLQEGSAGGASFSRLNQPQTEGSSTDRTPSANDVNEATLGLLANLVGLLVINAPYIFDGTELARATGGLYSVAAPTLASQVGQDVRSLGYAQDASTATDAVRITGDAATVDTPTLADVNGQDVRAFLYGLDSDTVTQAIRLRATAGGFLRTFTENAIPGTITTLTDVVTGAVASVLAANAARVQVIIQNLDATASNDCRVGESASIGAARGVRLLGGQSVTLNTTAEIFAVAVTGTPSISITEIAA